MDIELNAAIVYRTNEIGKKIDYHVRANYDRPTCVPPRPSPDRGRTGSTTFPSTFSDRRNSSTRPTHENIVRCTVEPRLFIEKHQGRKMSKTHVEQVRRPGRQVPAALYDPGERHDQQRHDLQQTTELPAGRRPVRRLRRVLPVVQPSVSAVFEHGSAEKLKKKCIAPLVSTRECVLRP